MLYTAVVGAKATGASWVNSRILCGAVCEMIGLRPTRSSSAFGVVGHTMALEGGQESSATSSSKALDLTEREVEWEAKVLSSISCDGFRVAHPRLRMDGSLVGAMRGSALRDFSRPVQSLRIRASDGNRTSPSMSRPALAQCATA